MRVKDEVEQILGKRIAGVVLKEPVNGIGPPAGQLFLLFDDGTHYEFYSDGGSIHTTGGVDRGGLNEVLAYMGERFKPVFVKYQG